MPRPWPAAAAAAAVASLAAAASVAGPAGARSSVYVDFRTPSGNISCAYARLSGQPAFLRCDIRSGLKPAPPRRPCVGDIGFAVGMGETGRAASLCVGDTTYNQRARVLPYGSSWKRDGFRCRSRPTGLTCTNLSGHGWFLSRERSRLF